MTDRTQALTVVLEKRSRVDDVEELTGAIGMMKGVYTVAPVVSDLDLMLAEQTAAIRWTRMLSRLACLGSEPARLRRIMSQIDLEFEEYTAR